MNLQFPLGLIFSFGPLEMTEGSSVCYFVSRLLSLVLSKSFSCCAYLFQFLIFCFAMSGGILGF